MVNTFLFYNSKEDQSSLYLKILPSIHGSRIRAHIQLAVCHWLRIRLMLIIQRSPLFITKHYLETSSVVVLRRLVVC